MEIAGVASNHEDMRAFVEWSGIAFHRLPDGKPAATPPLVVATTGKPAATTALAEAASHALARMSGLPGMWSDRKSSHRCSSIHAELIGRAAISGPAAFWPRVSW